MTSRGAIVSSTDERRIVLCPICGKRNFLDQTFHCRKCGREGLCKRHLNSRTEACLECSPLTDDEDAQRETARRQRFLEEYERESVRLRGELQRLDGELAGCRREGDSLGIEINELVLRVRQVQSQIAGEESASSSGDGSASVQVRLSEPGWGDTVVRYEGPVDSRGMPHGEGKLTLPDGSVYEGAFFCGTRSGKGRVRYKNGSYYEGGFHDGEWSGAGTYIWPDGTKYVGSFRGGQLHGHGTVYKPDGTEFSGTFRDGKMESND